MIRERNMGKCNHKKADKWTNIATVGEGLSSALSNFYWGVSLANLAYETPDEDASGAPLYVGLMLTLLAVGAMYAHRKLNTYHQHAAHEDDICQHSNTPVDPLAIGFVNERSRLKQNDHQHEHLTKIQKAALAADFVTHTGDVSGAITAGIDLVARFSAGKNSVPQWGRAIIQCCATLFGASSAVANVRSCKNAIVEQNKQNKTDDSRIRSERQETKIDLGAL